MYWTGEEYHKEEESEVGGKRWRWRRRKKRGRTSGKRRIPQKGKREKEEKEGREGGGD